MNNNTHFLNQRQSRIQQRLDRKRQPLRDRPVLESRNISYEIAGRTRAVGCGGFGLIQQALEATGLRAAIEA